MSEQDFNIELLAHHELEKIKQKLYVAFCAEVGCAPSEAEAVMERKPNGDISIFIRKRVSDVIEMPAKPHIRGVT